MGQIVQLVIAIAMGVAILSVGRWAVRLLASAGPEEIDPDSVVEVEQSFRCLACGLQLTVTYAQGDDVAAPRHCREEMEPV